MPFQCLPADLSTFLCVSGFHRNEDMKAIDVLPILKEKVAFLSGQMFIVTVYIYDIIGLLSLHKAIRTAIHALQWWEVTTKLDLYFPYLPLPKKSRKGLMFQIKKSVSEIRFF